MERRGRRAAAARWWPPQRRRRESSVPFRRWLPGACGRLRFDAASLFAAVASIFWGAWFRGKIQPERPHGIDNRWAQEGKG